MAKKKAAARKAGGAAAIAIIDDDDESSIGLHEEDTITEGSLNQTNQSAATAKAPKTERKTKPSKAVPQSSGQFRVGDIRKAATFANSVGGLDSAIALLQILKVAKEVQ